MGQILAWGGNSEPVKSDFINNKNAFQEKYKINKMGVNYITEKQDNYRDPVEKCTVPKHEQLVKYLQDENQTLIRKKVYKNLKDKDLM